jgi:hypothetical protein
MHAVAGALLQCRQDTKLHARVDALLQYQVLKLLKNLLLFISKIVIFVGIST